MGRRRRASDIHGVVIVDKPPGSTSHDVVQRVRRALGQPRVGHAGTLDPMATGVLVVMAGEATKLGPYLTADDKRYAASVRLGVATDTGDAEGAIIEQAPLPPWWTAEAAERVAGALVGERLRGAQQPPIYSAIKIAGKSAHARARAGEEVSLEPRPVAVRSLELTELDLETGRLGLALTVSKGYYVRSLARDLGQALGVPAHLDALRRTGSGVFGIDEAIAVEAVSAERLIATSAAAARALPAIRLTPEGVARARHGGAMQPEHFVEPHPPDRACAWLDGTDALVAVGAQQGHSWVVLRGFR